LAHAAYPQLVAVLELMMFEKGEVLVVENGILLIREMVDFLAGGTAGAATDTEGEIDEKGV
jgi:hypothetical protein